MKPNKLTPGSNMIHEASRMMLPEHKEALICHRKELNRKQRPILDEQKLQDISYAISESMSQREPFTFVLFGEYEDRELTGVVEKVDQQLRCVKVITGEDDWEWIKLSDIINTK